MQDTYDYIVVTRNDTHILATNYTYILYKLSLYVSKQDIYIIKNNWGMCVCPGLPWPYLWTDFQTKGTYGLLMTQG